MSPSSPALNVPQQPAGAGAVTFTARPLDVEGATRRIESLLDERGEIGWLEALGPRPTIVDLLSTLLAILELAKRGSLRITQPAPFSPMVIARDATRPAA